MRQLLISILNLQDSGIAVLAGRLVLDLLSTSVIVFVAYSRVYRNRDYIFTYVLLNLVTFSLVFVLSSIPVELGFALGLFAVFGILRYRTEAIEVRNLTYLFVVIGIALLNALANGRVGVIALMLVNGVIVGAVCALEAAPFSRREYSRLVRYDRLELISADRAAELLEDLRRRTHLPVVWYEVGDVDLLRDTADITIHYPRDPNPQSPIPNP
jgi:hypothetical protein